MSEVVKESLEQRILTAYDKSKETKPRKVDELSAAEAEALQLAARVSESVLRHAVTFAAAHARELVAQERKAQAQEEQPAVEA